MHPLFIAINTIMLAKERVLFQIYPHLFFINIRRSTQKSFTFPIFPAWLTSPPFPLVKAKLPSSLFQNVLREGASKSQRLGDVNTSLLVTGRAGLVVFVPFNSLGPLSKNTFSHVL